MLISADHSISRDCQMRNGEFIMYITSVACVQTYHAAGYTSGAGEGTNYFRTTERSMLALSQWFIHSPVLKTKEINFNLGIAGELLTSTQKNPINIIVTTDEPWQVNIYCSRKFILYHIPMFSRRERNDVRFFLCFG